MSKSLKSPKQGRLGALERSRWLDFCRYLSRSNQLPYKFHCVCGGTIVAGVGNESPVHLSCLHCGTHEKVIVYRGDVVVLKRVEGAVEQGVKKANIAKLL